MVSRKFYIFPMLLVFVLNFFPFFQKTQSSSDKLHYSIYSGYLKSQKKIIESEKFNLACKFKSMNRKTTKKEKLKNLVSKYKI